MAKEKERVELRPVDETAEDDSRLFRLHKDTVEEFEELPTVRVGEKEVPEARLIAATRDELKTRSNDPGVESLIEREEEESQESGWDAPAAIGRIPWGWIALVGCAFAAGILWSLIEVNRSKDRHENLLTETKGILEKEREEELAAEMMIETIEGTVSDFYDSRTVEELLRYVRHPQRVKPLMEKYYAENPMEPTRVLGIRSLDPLTIDSHATFWIVGSELEDSTVSQVLVEALSGKVAKIDWETYVCYQPMDWDKFVKVRQPGDTQEFRVYVEIDNFYSHEFADSDSFASYRLSALGEEQILYGYAKRNSPLMMKMNRLISENGGGATPMILSLTVPQSGGSKRGVFVNRLVSPRWMFVESPEAGE